MDCLYHFHSIHLKHYTVKPETLTSFMIDVFNQSSLDNVLKFIWIEYCALCHWSVITVIITLWILLCT